MKPYLAGLRPLPALRPSCLNPTRYPRTVPRWTALKTKPTPRHSSRPLHTSNVLRQPEATLAAATPKPYKSYKPVRSLLYVFCVLSGVAVSVSGAAAALAYYTHFETAPVTGRRRFMWYRQTKDEEIGYFEQNFLLDQYKKLQLPPDDVTTKAIQGILDRLKTSKYTEGINWRLHFIDDFEWPNNFAVPGGQIYINTGMILECKNPDQVAGTLAHEMGHIISRHGAESKSFNFVGKWLCKLLGLEGELGRNLVLSRRQEAEADQIGLIVMADAGFDPAERVSAMRDRLEKDREQLKGRDPFPEFLSTHPSAENRLQQHEAWLPTAEALYMKRGPRPISKEDETNWLQCRAVLLAMSLESSRLSTNSNINERIDECQKKHLELSDSLWKLRDELFNVALTTGHVEERSASEIAAEEKDEDNDEETAPQEARDAIANEDQDQDVTPPSAVPASTAAGDEDSSPAIPQHDDDVTDSKPLFGSPEGGRTTAVALPDDLTPATLETEELKSAVDDEIKTPTSTATPEPRLDEICDRPLDGASGSTAAPAATGRVKNMADRKAEK